MKTIYLLAIGLTAALSLYAMPTQALAGGPHIYVPGYNSYGWSFWFSFGGPVYPRYHAPPPKYYHHPGKPHWRSYRRGPHKHYGPPVKRYRKHYGRHWRPPVHHHRGYAYR